MWAISGGGEDEILLYTLRHDQGIELHIQTSVVLVVKSQLMINKKISTYTFFV